MKHDQVFWRSHNITALSRRLYHVSHKTVLGANIIPNEYILYYGNLIIIFLSLQTYVICSQTVNISVYLFSIK